MQNKSSVMTTECLSLQEAHQTLDDLQASMGDVSEKMKSAAQYFCQDTSKFKLEDLLAELLTFVKDFTNAKKVSIHGDGVARFSMCWCMVLKLSWW